MVLALTELSTLPRMRFGAQAKVGKVSLAVLDQ
jgi:hypothetical protein